MKKIKTTLFGAMLLAFAACAAGCDTGGEKGTESGSITVKDKGALTQELFADETSGKSPVEFTTLGAWSSKIVETGRTRDAQPAPAPKWISITPTGGDKAGDYSVAITLKPNTTAKERTAVVTISSEGSEIKVTVTQKATDKEGSLPDIDDIVENSIQLYLDALMAYYTVDAALPDLASRERLTASEKSLYDLWTKAYQAIESCNQITETLDLYPDLSESAKSEITGAARLRMGTLYLYLVSLFGDVPMPGDGETYTQIPRRPSDEVKDRAKADLEYANQFLGGSDKAEAMYMCGLQGMQRGDFDYALDLLKNAIESGKLVWDANVDGKFDQSDNSIAVHAHLLAAEASLENENREGALGYVNRIYAELKEQPYLSEAATIEEIREGIRTTFSSWNTGLKIMNAERWGETAEWDFRALLPIPQAAMDENKHLLQNPGWDPAN